MQKKDFQRSTDDVLLTLWKKGDVKAYETLFLRYYDSLFLYVCGSVKNTMLAEELVMDVMMRVWQKGDKITSPPGFKAYLLRSIKNAVLNYYRKSAPDILPIDELSDENAPPTSSLADDLVRHKELAEQYTVAFSSLSDKKKEVFTLSREKNLTYKEIAQLLGISLNTVENYMSASLSQLREKMK